MNGASFYQAVSAVFIAQVFGLDLTFTQQLTIVLTATLASIGAPGVPGGAVIMLVIVLGSVGIPAEGLALILGIERPLDMIRTVANVTGDAAVAAIVESGEIRREKRKSGLS
jgi:Na+/H+-dicarboxylate symporter